MLKSEFDNLTRWNGREKPFYETYYLKVNEPSLGAALWIRYTFLSPVNSSATASVWAVFFDSRNPSRNLALKETVFMNEAVFLKSKFSLDIGGAVLDNNSASGSLKNERGHIAWNIAWRPTDSSFRHYPFFLYFLPWPASKVVAPNLNAPSAGWFEVNGVKYQFSSVVHQGHVWGKSYSKKWFWADCGMFKEDKSAVLELIAKPPFGLGYLKFGGEKIRFIASGDYSLTGCEFKGRNFSTKIAGKISTENIIGITYQDPNGGERYCYNTNVGSAIVNIYKKCGRKWQFFAELASQCTTAYESVTSMPVSTIPISL